MIAKRFEPTDEQQRVIDHSGSAFITACPGAGKTRVMVERARRLLGGGSTDRGVAFLSFTTAAISEFEGRLRREGLVETPSFPHFIGTFDAFLWQLLVAPFGIEGSAAKPKLVPDKEKQTIQPFSRARSLPLECFDRATGNAIPTMTQRHGFRGNIRAHETAARNTRARALERGELDFIDARTVALTRLRDPASGGILGSAFAARFQELIVDEAQDCNPVDLEVITWFRKAGVPVKVICDPNQAIYGFRGGVTVELDQFSATFDEADRLLMNGNFRSSKNITKGMVALRAPRMRAVVDEALGEHRKEPTAVKILSYSSRGVPASIGEKFQHLTALMGLEARDCPVVAATRRTCANALGHPKNVGVNDMSYRLAVAVSKFHFSFEIGGRKEALITIHKIMLELGEKLDGNTYHQYLADAEVTPETWRPDAVVLAQALRFSSQRFSTANEWHDNARRMLAPLIPSGGRSINQWLRRNRDLVEALSAAQTSGHPAQTIHAVKGMEFPAICVVMAPSSAKSIIDFLASDAGGDNEEARKIYVGASRAQRLLAIAVPRTQAPRLKELMLSMGGNVDLIPV